MNKATQRHSYKSHEKSHEKWLPKDQHKKREKEKMEEYYSSEEFNEKLRHIVGIATNGHC